MATTKEEALRYHSEGRKGKIEVIATKPCFTSRELSLAYTPGVAEPCRDIHKNDDDVYNYTAKGNLVAVVSNGTAVLGLGNIGPHAGKPVMEGKGVLFKRFADIDVFDIELKTEDADEVIRAVQLLEPTFGGINLEDIKAPECFVIEEKLKETLDIPVFHDDQHGTAIISCAALLNAAELAGKKLGDVRVVVSGAGASAIACSNLYVLAGVKRENIAMFDSKGHIYKGRERVNEYKAQFAQEKPFDSLAHAVEGADVFIGLSQPNVLTPDMVKTMAAKPIVFAMANPDPEITYPEAVGARDDIIMATGRSDYPNQVNNVLGFPFIFRGALDVRSKAITDGMKMAAVKALADLAREEVTDQVMSAYGGDEFEFGPNYIIPKPFDPRVLWKVAPAVAKAAVEEGVARKPIEDWGAYEEELKERLGYSTAVVRSMVAKAQKSPKKIVYPEGEEEKIIRAAHSVYQDKIGLPVLLGNEDVIRAKVKELGFAGDAFELHDPKVCERCKEYGDEFYNIRQRRGVTRKAATELIRESNYYGAMMVKMGDADALIGGLTTHYPDMIRPALQTVGVREGFNVVSGLYIVIIRSRVFFFADTTVNIDPTAEQLAEIALTVADEVRGFDVEPRVAMLSFSNFGSVEHPLSVKVKKAVEIAQQKNPELAIDGEMQADTAIVPDILKNEFPFAKLDGGANVLVFPNLAAGNIAYKLFERLTDATVIGPILVGMKKPVHVLQRGATVDDIINMTAIAVVEATRKQRA